MITVLPSTTEKPLQMIGATAGVCWGANISDTDKNINRAIDCIKSGHDRVMEWPIVDLIVDGYSAKCIREVMRHIVGTSVLQASTRYIDYEKKGVPVVTPPSIANNELAKEAWDETIEAIKKGMKALKALGVPNEDVTNLLPLAYQTKMVWRANLRTLVHFMNTRLCNRAYLEIRNLSNDLKKALSDYSDEWKIICDNLFVPKCEVSGYCTETKCCGRKPQKQKEINL